MKLVIEARFEDEVGEAHTFNLAKIERGELRLGNIGMTLDEGRDLLIRAQHTDAALQTTNSWASTSLAHPAYAAAARLINELLHVENAISVMGIKNRVRSMGQTMEREPRENPRQEFLPPADC